MRILLLKDKVSNEFLLKQVQEQVEDIYKRNTGVQLEWVIEETDYTNYEVEEYLPWRGLFGLRRSDIAVKTADIYRRYREEIDMVVYLIDSSNWKLTGVWGWAISKAYSGYGVLQVRFASVPSHGDVRNVNNTVGTLYHELMHDHDTFVFTYTGKLVENIVPVEGWDSFAVHGGRDLGREGENGWKYIRHNENQHALKAISKEFNEALIKRRSLFIEYTDLQRRVIQLLEQKVVLLRQLLSQAKGDVPILEGNKCLYGKDK